MDVGGELGWVEGLEEGGFEEGGFDGRAGLKDAQRGRRGLAGEEEI